VLIQPSNPPRCNLLLYAWHEPLKTTGEKDTKQYILKSTALMRRSARPPAAASLRNIGNCFMKTNLHFTSAKRWLQRLV